MFASRSRRRQGALPPRCSLEYCPGNSCAAITKSEKAFHQFLGLGQGLRSAGLEPAPRARSECPVISRTLRNGDSAAFATRGVHAKPSERGETRDAIKGDR